MSCTIPIPRTFAVLAVLALSGLAMSCTDSTGPEAPKGTYSRLSAPSGLLEHFMKSRPLDREFWKIAQAVPGFGGAYLDSDGTPVIVLLDVNSLASAASAVRAALVTRKDQTLNRPMRAVSGQYDFLTLANLHFQLVTLHSINGVVGTGIDERRNRVVIGFSDPSALPRIDATLMRMGIPREAVIIEREAAVVFSSSLASFIRPVENGYRITGSQSCTIGINASQNGTGAAYAIEPGHCTNIIGAVDGTQFFQPDPTTAPARIGVEISDVAYFAGDNLNGCATGRYCTYADAALIKYDHDGDQNPQFNIAVTDFRSGPGQGPGSANVQFTTMIYAVEGYNILPAMQGWVLDRIGPEAGWTYGTVLDKCFDVNIVGTNLTLLCQTKVSGLQLDGDSGSQVFSTRTDNTWYSLYGMATTTRVDGTAFYYTPMSTIMDKLNTNSYPLHFCAC